MRPGAVLVLGLILVSGCASPTGPAPSPSTPVGGTAGAAPSGFLSRCPGSTDAPSNATCTRTITLPDVGLEEPSLAVDPSDPGRLVIAANALGPPPRPGPTGTAVLHLEFFSTSNGGKTRTRQTLPSVDAPGVAGPVAATIVYDGSVAYASNGTLFLAGIASNNGGGGGCQPGAITWPFETHSLDNGKTWSAPHVLEQAVSDRTWLTLGDDGTAYVDWYLPCERKAHAARSTDGGRTWETTSLPCGLTTPFAVEPGRVRAGCGNKILVWDRTGPIEVGPAETVPGLAWRLARAPDGGWALFTADFAKNKVYLAWADPTLANWSAPVDLLATTPTTQAWQADRLFAAGLDGQGVAHAILVGSPYPQQCDISNGIAYRETPGGCDVVHLALAHNANAPIEARVLSSGEPAARTPPSPTLGLGVGATGDDYAGIAFQGNATYVAWPREGSLLLTELQAEWSSV